MNRPPGEVLFGVTETDSSSLLEGRHFSSAPREGKERAFQESRAAKWSCSNEQLNGKRVLFVFCTLELGGAERQGMYLARHLKTLGCDVTVWGHATPGVVADQCSALGIPWAIHRFRWPCRKSSLVRDSWRMVRALRRQRPDIILAYTTWANVSCGLLWRWSTAKICIWGQRDVHSLRGDVVERLAYRRASAVICNATHAVDHLRRTLGVTQTPISVVHNGLDLAPCQKSRNAWRAELGINLDAPVAIMLANFRPEKDHRTLLRAWGKVMEREPSGPTCPRLLLAGAPQHAYRDVFHLAGKLGLLNTVSFLGQVQDVTGLLAASDIGVLTSTHEGLPNAIIEYMASGLPVVATDLPGNREALGDEYQARCVPGDHDFLADQILHLVRDADLRDELGQRNRQCAASTFSMQTMCGRTVEIITDLLGAETRNPQS